MYKIIGADQKEYGPVTSDQIRQWVRDGRVNAQTQARLEPGGQWQPLSAFPEFSDAFGVGAPAMAPAATPTPFPMGGGSREAAMNAVKGPAIALIVMGGMGVALFLLAAAGNFIGGTVFHQRPPANLSSQGEAIYQFLQKAGGPMYLFFAIMDGFVLFAGIKMLRLESRTLCIVACIVAMLPFTTYCCCLLGLPFGIWGLVVMNKPEVKSHFT